MSLLCFFTMHSFNYSFEVMPLYRREKEVHWGTERVLCLSKCVWSPKTYFNQILGKPTVLQVRRNRYLELQACSFSFFLCVPVTLQFLKQWQGKVEKRAVASWLQQLLGKSKLPSIRRAIWTCVFRLVDSIRGRKRRREEKTIKEKPLLKGKNEL